MSTLASRPRHPFAVFAALLTLAAGCGARGSGDADDDTTTRLSALRSPAEPDRVGPGEQLGPGDSITSRNGLYTLVCQGDGNLVMYRNRTGAYLWMPLWSTHTQGVMGVCTMQSSDGNFVVYLANGSAAWHTQTHSPANAGAVLVMQDDGNIVIYKGTTALWASWTVQPPDRTALTHAGRLTIQFPGYPTEFTPTPRLATDFELPSGVTRTFKGDTFVTDSDRGTVLQVHGDSIWQFSPTVTSNQLSNGGAEEGPNVLWSPEGVDDDYPTVQPPDVCTGCMIPFEGNYYFGINKGSLTNTAQLTLLGSRIDQGQLTLAFTAYVRTGAKDWGPDMARVTLEYLNASAASFNPPARFDSGVLVNNDQWTRIYDARKPPVGTRYAKVTLYASNPSPYDNHAFFDAISLIVRPSSSTVFLHGPRGLVNADSAASPANNVIVANTFNHTIVKLTSTSTSSSAQILVGTSETPGGGTTKLNTPMQVAMASNGDLYIADSGNHRITRLAKNATSMTTIAGTGVPGKSGDGGSATNAQLRYPSGVAIGPGGEIYIADRGNGVIRKVDTSGNISTFAGKGTGASAGYAGDGNPPLQAKFTRLDALTVGADGYLYISDNGNHNVRRIKGSSGLMETVVGNGMGTNGSDTGDGASAIEAHLWTPSGIAVDPANGDLYVADARNHRVRLVSCSDDSKCTGTESYSNSTGRCSAGTPVATNDNNACTNDVCNPATGAVTHPAISVDDGNSCTTDTCNTTSGPVHTVNAGAACNDDNLCTSGDRCRTDGRCLGDGLIVVTPTPCAPSTCNPATGISTPEMLAAGTSCGTGVVCDGGGICESPPPTLAVPAIDFTHATLFADAVRFLYSGAGAIQTGVAGGVIDDTLVALVSGKVVLNGKPLSNVKVKFPALPQYGETRTRVDGRYDMVVNAAPNLTIRFDKTGYLAADRIVSAVAGKSKTIPDVTLKQLDPKATSVNFGAGSNQLAVGTMTDDTAGKRTAAVLVPAGTTATKIVNGVEIPASTLNLRMTEYTNGAAGPSAMPAPIAPNTAYTYAVEVSADGADGVKFGSPVAFYVDNFLKFPVGEKVPTGFYDKTKNAWVKSANGVVIKIVSVTSGVATVDTGGGTNGLGLTLAERTTLGGKYAAGTTLWRVPMTHLTPYDCNWPYGPPPCQGTICPGPGGKAAGGEPPLCTTVAEGSIIECEAQGLGESLPVAGTPYSLNYRSSREPGYAGKRQIHLDLTGPIIHTELKDIEVVISIAGQRNELHYAPTPNLSVDWTWNGKDTFDRVLVGAATAHVTITPKYYALYLPADSFGDPSPTPNVSFAARRTDLTYDYPNEFTVDLVGALPREGWKLGGWTLSPHHFLDTKARLLYLGNGSVRKVDLEGLVVRRIAGNGSDNYGADGSNALDTGFSTNRYTDSIPGGIAVGPTGEVVIADTGHRVVRRIGHDGKVRTVAGVFDSTAPCGQGATLGDGLPATQAHLFTPTAVAYGPDGSLYIADGGLRTVRRVGADGKIQTIAGVSCTAGYNGDNQPAVNAWLNEPTGLAVAADGSVFIADQRNYRVRKVDPAGIITTVAGDGVSGPTEYGKRATTVHVNPEDLALGPDGTLYVAGSSVMTVRADGFLRELNAPFTNWAWTQEGVPISTQPVDMLRTIGMTGMGGLIYNDDDWGRQHRPDGSRQLIRIVDPQGIVRSVSAGLASSIAIDGGAALRQGPTSILAVAGGPHDSVVVHASSRLYRLEHPNTQGLSMCMTSAARYLIPAGQQGFCFDAEGRHLSTVDLRTLQRILRFDYTGGALTTITDADDNKTTIMRDASGYTVTAPFLQQTILGTDSNGYLNAIGDAGGTAYPRHAANGLLTSYVDRRGFQSIFEYNADGTGLLAKDRAAVGTTHESAQTLSRTSIGGGIHVVRTTPLGIPTSYSLTRTPDNVVVQSRQSASGNTTSRTLTVDGVDTIETPDGTQYSAVMGPSARFNMYQPLASTQVIKLPSQKTYTVNLSQTASLVEPGNPASFVDERLVRKVVGGSPVGWTRAYDAGNHTELTMSPLGKLVSRRLDAFGRPVRVDVNGITGVDITYDRGRVKTVTQGSRVMRLDYELNGPSAGYLKSVTDPLNQVTSWTRDALGRPQTETRGSAVIGFGWNANNNLTRVTPPQRPDHLLDYSPFGRLTFYDPPNLPSLGIDSTIYRQSPDRDAYQDLRPGTLGAAVTNGSDGFGRRSTVTMDNGTTVMTSFYPAGSTAPGAAGGRVSQIATTLNQKLNFSYDGFLVTRTAWSGPVTGAVDWGYNDLLLQRVSETVSGVTGTGTITFGYDADGLLTCASPTSCATPGADALKLDRNVNNGKVQTVTTGRVVEKLTFNEFGELATQVVSGPDPTGATGTLLSFTYDSPQAPRDALGRIVRRTDTVGATTTVWDYAYTKRRLSDVRRDGQPFTHFDYDDNGNRPGVQADAQDRIGDGSVTYTANGEVRTKTSAGTTWTYTYDALGSLMSAASSGGTTVDYVVDGLGRRVGKKVNGVMVRQWLYRNQLSPIAELDKYGKLVAQFVYASRSDVPDLVLREGKTYRVIADHLGSPRYAVNVNDSTDVPFTATYDVYGAQTSSAPDWLPFGFAGGLYDSDTRLMRFGARDYDPTYGRWMAKDPHRFSDSPNLYEYANGDPLNRRDRQGFAPNGWDRLIDTLNRCDDALDQLTAGPEMLSAPFEFQDVCRRQCIAAGMDPGCPCDFYPQLFTPDQLNYFKAFMPLLPFVETIPDFKDAHGDVYPNTSNYWPHPGLCDDDDPHHYHSGPRCPDPADYADPDPCSSMSSMQCDCVNMSSDDCG